MLDVFFKLHEIKLPEEQRKQFIKCIYRLQAFGLLQQDDAKGRQLKANFVGQLVQCAGEFSREQFRFVWTRTPATFLIKLVK
jgi:hypothetical protein